MKKILFATTALVATASVAAADVTFSGYGRFGVKYSGSVAAVDETNGAQLTADVALTHATDVDFDSGTAGTADSIATQSAAITTARAALDAYEAATALTVAEQATLAADRAALDTAAATLKGTDAVAAIASDTLITSRLHLIIDGSTETDSGVTFGATVKVQQDDGNTNAFNAARFYAKTGGLEVAVGNIYGVIDNMAGLYSGSVGLTGLGFSNVVSNFGDLGGSSTGAGQAGTKEAAEIMYSMGDYAFAVATNGTDTEYGVSATMSGWTVALSGSDTDTAANAEWVATVGGTIGGVTVGLATAEAVSGDSSTTLSAKFSVGAATTVTAYYNDDEANTVDDKSYGLGFSHGLGGGTSLNGGIVTANDRTFADFGVKFNF